MAMHGNTRLNPAQLAAAVGSMENEVKRRWTKAIEQMSKQNIKDVASIMNMGTVPPGSDQEMLRDMLNEALKDEND